MLNKESKKFKIINKVVQDRLNERPAEILRARSPKPIYKVMLSDGQIIRLDLGRPNIREAEFQTIAYKNGVNVPRILALDQRAKLSRWIDGIELSLVLDLPNAIIEMGKLLGKLNITKDGDGYLSHRDIYIDNFIWSKDKKLYLVDMGGLSAFNYTKAVSYTVKGVCKFISDNQIEWFHKGYSRYHDDWEKYISMC